MNEKVYLGEKQADGKTDMTPFNKLFGGKNSNVFKTAYMIVEGEMKNPHDWGFVELDPKRTFSKNDIQKRLALSPILFFWRPLLHNPEFLKYPYP